MSAQLAADPPEPLPLARVDPHPAGALAPPPCLPLLCRRDTFHEENTSQELVTPKKWLCGKKTEPPKG